MSARLVHAGAALTGSLPLIPLCGVAKMQLSFAKAKLVNRQCYVTHAQDVGAVSMGLTSLTLRHAGTNVLRAQQ